MQIDDERDIIAHVRDATWVRRLIQHVPRCASEGSAYEHMGPPRRRLRGVTSVMSAELWAPGRRRRIKQASETSATPPKTKKKRRQASATNKGVILAVSGAMRGSLIHRQLHDVIVLDERAFSKLHPEGSHPWLRPLMSTLVERGWWPLRSEYVTCDLALLMATRIDLICVDRDGRLVFIELKTGYDGATFTDTIDGAWRPGTAPRRHGWPCTAFRRAVMQCMLGGFMLARELALPDTAYRMAVVRVDETRVELIEVAHAVLESVGLPAYIGIMEAEQQRQRQH